MAVTSYQDIKTMSAAFKAMLDANKTTLPFDVDNSAVVVLVDVVTALQTILTHAPSKLAVAIGLQNNKLTICLLGADASGHPLTGSLLSPLSGSSFTDDELPGQEAWPNDEQITNSENGAYNDFFQ